MALFSVFKLHLCLPGALEFWEYHYFCYYGCMLYLFCNSNVNHLPIIFHTISLCPWKMRSTFDFNTLERLPQLY